MEALARPFARLWDWIAREGGLPGQMFFVCVVVISLFGLFTYLSNRRA